MGLSRVTQFGSIALILLAASELPGSRLAMVTLGVIALWLSSYIIGLEASHNV